MIPKFVVFFAATAAANFTTSFWLQNNLGTDRIRYVASVVDADEDRLTLAASYDNDPDYSALGIDEDATDTITLASTLYEYSTAQIFNRATTPTAGESAYHLRCELQSTIASADCTVSVGKALGQGRCRSGNYISRDPTTRTLHWTFSDTDTAGVATLTRSIPGSPTTPIPDWCSTGSGGYSDISVPSSELLRTFKVDKSTFALYTFVITAGEEKIPSATTGGSASTASVTPTGSGGGSENPASETSGSPGAAPMRTVAPALAGLGAAVAVFL
ncbi:hypothetical protein N0V90_002593 [Kalmusia sp. IMI 367209]|nr:hypothetical protein N0V90_002593 [Kalmusia sp. IMI 367209]